MAIAEASRASIYLSLSLSFSVSLSLSLSLFFCETLCVSSPPLFAYGILKNRSGLGGCSDKGNYLHPFRHVESFDGAAVHDPLSAGSGV